MATRSVKDRLLDVATELAQTMGYNGFSYRDLADRVGVKTATVHYYFRRKEDLGRALIQRYREQSTRDLASLDETHVTPLEKLERYIELLFVRVYEDGDRLCLGGMFAAELPTIPQTLQPEISQFFAQHETWLTQVLADAVEADQIAPTIDPTARAKVMFAALEGAMLTARAFDDPNRLRETGRQLLDELTDQTTAEAFGP